MLKRKLKENKENLSFVTIYNECKPEYIGLKRKANKVQTNAFTLLTEQERKVN